MSITIKGPLNLKSGRLKLNQEPGSPPPPVFTNTLAYTLTNPAPDKDDYFGHSVSASNNRVIIGTPGGFDDPGSEGIAYIYDSTTGNLLHTLTNPTPATNDFFGCSVSISGNRAIVGAYSDDTGTLNTGSAYIYDVTTGNLLHTINNPTPSFNDSFGWSVAISGDRAIVGAYNDDTGAVDSGSAYIYDVTTGNLLHTINNPTLNESDRFGTSVAISGDIAVVGSPNIDSLTGGAYIYSVTTGSLLHTLSWTSTQQDEFGFSLAISGNRVIVGAPDADGAELNQGRAFIYDATTGNLLHTIENPTPQEGGFGAGVAIDGNQVVVAYSRSRDNCRVFDVTTGSLLYTIDNPNQSNDFGVARFTGEAIAIDGVNIAAGVWNNDTGASNAGAVYLFN